MKPIKSFLSFIIWCNVLVMVQNMWQTNICKYNASYVSHIKKTLKILIIYPSWGLKWENIA